MRVIVLLLKHRVEVAGALHESGACYNHSLGHHEVCRVSLRGLALATALTVLSGCATAVLTGAASPGAQDGTAVTADDARLARDVKTALLRDPAVSQFDFRVSAKAGNITLQGVVNGDSTRSKAEQVAKQVNGVQRIINELVIEP